MRDYLKPAHGKQAETTSELVVEVEPHDEVPIGTRAPAPTADDGSHDGNFNAAGGFAPGNKISQLGGIKRAEKLRFERACEQNLGLADVGPHLRPYIRGHAELARSVSDELCQDVGGGRIGAIVHTLVQAAMVAFATSRADREASSKENDLALRLKLQQEARQQETAGRQNLLAAWSLAARAAQARGGANINDPEALEARIVAMAESYRSKK